MRQLLLTAVVLMGWCGTALAVQSTPDCSQVFEYKDAVTGRSVRQLRKADGHEHNIYHFRNVFNADETLLFAVQSDLNQQNWRQSLYTSDGCFLRHLPGTADWRIVWSATDPKVFYTHSGQTIYAYDVSTDTKKPIGTMPYAPVAQSLSLSGDGSRLGAYMEGQWFMSLALPSGGDIRTFQAACPPGYHSGLGMYLGWLRKVGISCSNDTTNAQELRIHEDDGALVVVRPFVYIGHPDISKDGLYASVQRPFEITVQDLLTGVKTVLYSLPTNLVTHFFGSHNTWPRDRSDWFIVSLFLGNDPNLTYSYPMDELLKVTLPTATSPAKVEVLARTGSTLMQGFWGQSNAAISRSGQRIQWNSPCDPALQPTPGCLSTGTIDLFLLNLASNQLPTVNAGPDQKVSQAVGATLTGTVSDDSPFTVTWSKVSGPGTVTFANPATLVTKTNFNKTGVYVLRLTVTDGEFTVSDDLTITVTR
jgi:hypothetical protein